MVYCGYAGGDWRISFRKRRHPNMVDKGEERSSKHTRQNAAALSWSARPPCDKTFCRPLGKAAPP